MSNKVKTKNDIKKKYGIVILIVTLMVCIVGATYAFFALSAADESVKGTIAAVGMDLTVNRIAPSSTKWEASTHVMVPQLDAGLASAINATNNCIDGNNNIVCQVLEITIKNTSTAAVKLNGTIDFSTSDGSMFTNIYWREATSPTVLGNNNTYKGTNDETVFSTTSGAPNAFIVKELSLAANNGSKTYYIVVWVREINNAQNTADVGTCTVNINFVDAVSGKGITSTITS